MSANKPRISAKVTAALHLVSSKQVKYNGLTNFSRYGRGNIQIVIDICPQAPDKAISSKCVLQFTIDIYHKLQGI